MKYLVIYEQSQSVSGARTGLDGRPRVIEQSFSGTRFMVFDDATEATEFCKEKNGYVVKALDLVLEKDEEPGV